MTTRCRTVPSPIGPLTLAGVGATVTHLRMAQQSWEPDSSGWVPDRGAFPKVVDQLEAYFAGELTDFDVDLEMPGTPFQQRVWAALRRIPYGETRSYGQIAAQIGNPGASRAVGLANRRNPVAIIVPCHRVIGASGQLTGFGGGIGRKRALLELEGGAGLF
jgi:methylated-DNA-[protein]-cysteine S-methyltransferase